jgi:hypothetical protein
VADHIETTVRLASMRQIHGAIEHLNKGDFECAITLAGAAEGILPDTDAPHFRQKVEELSVSLAIKAEGGATGSNDYINWLKHGQTKAGGPRVEGATVTELEVITVIWRAITKFHATYSYHTAPMLKFADRAKTRLQPDWS